MRANVLFFLTILACVCLTLAKVTYDDCCLTYVKQNKVRIQKYAVSYRVQVTDGDCNIDAIIFTLKRGRIMCTDPKEKWVKDVQRRIDEGKIKKQSKPHMKNNYRG